MQIEASLLFGYFFNLAMTWPWLVYCTTQFSKLDGFYPPMTCTTQILGTEFPILAPSSLTSTRSTLHFTLRSVWSSHPSRNPSHLIIFFMLHLIGNSMLCQCTTTIRTFIPLVVLRRIQSPQKLLHGPIGTNVFITFNALARILASPLGWGIQAFWHLPTIFCF